MNWSVYNQSLVRRGEILIGFDIIDNWDTELKEMNKKIKSEESHFIIQTLFFFFSYLAMPPRLIFIYHTDKPKKVSHKVMPKGKYLLYQILQQ